MSHQILRRKASSNILITMTDNQPVDILKTVVLSASATVRCTVCGAEEMVMALDDKPLDEAFLANYICDECEASDNR